MFPKYLSEKSVIYTEKKAFSKFLAYFVEFDEFKIFEIVQISSKITFWHTSINDRDESVALTEMVITTRNQLCGRNSQKWKFRPF